MADVQPPKSEKIITQQRKRINTMKKTVAILAIVALFLAGSISVIAQPRGGDRGPRKEMMHKRIMKELNLTSDQEQKLEALRDKHHDSMDNMRIEMQKRRDAMHEYLKAGNVERAKYNELSAAVSSQREQIRKANDNHFMDVLDVLTPEQKKEFLSKMGERRERGMRGGDDDDDERGPKGGRPGKR